MDENSLNSTSIDLPDPHRELQNPILETYENLKLQEEILTQNIKNFLSINTKTSIQDSQRRDTLSTINQSFQNLGEHQDQFLEKTNQSQEFQNFPDQYGQILSLEQNQIIYVDKTNRLTHETINQDRALELLTELNQYEIDQKTTATNLEIQPHTHSYELRDTLFRMFPEITSVEAFVLINDLPDILTDKPSYVSALRNPENWHPHRYEIQKQTADNFRESLLNFSKHLQFFDQLPSLHNHLKDKKSHIIVATGPAGAGKTTAITKWLSQTAENLKQSFNHLWTKVDTQHESENLLNSRVEAEQAASALIEKPQPASVDIVKHHLEQSHSFQNIFIDQSVNPHKLHHEAGIIFSDVHTELARLPDFNYLLDKVVDVPDLTAILQEAQELNKTVEVKEFHVNLRDAIIRMLTRKHLNNTEPIIPLDKLVHSQIKAAFSAKEIWKQNLWQDPAIQSYEWYTYDNQGQQIKAAYTENGQLYCWHIESQSFQPQDPNQPLPDLFNNVINYDLAESYKDINSTRLTPEFNKRYIEHTPPEYQELIQRTLSDPRYSNKTLVEALTLAYQSN